MKDKLFITVIGLLFILVGVGKFIQGFYFDTCISPEPIPCQVAGMCALDGGAIICYIVNLMKSNEWIAVAFSVSFILVGLALVIPEWLPPNKACTRQGRAAANEEVSE